MTSLEFDKLLDRISFDHLPGETAHQELSPLKTEIRSVELQKNPNPRLSAVSILLYPKEDQAHFVLTKRHVYNGAHSGQISFPGGKKEEDDDSHEHTALRETHEEVGVHPEQAKVIGGLTPTYIPPSKFLVYPFVVATEDTPQFNIQEEEVDQLIEVKIADLIHPEVIKVTPMDFGNGMKVKVPYFDLNGEVVWGATAMILNEFKELILRHR